MVASGDAPADLPPGVRTLANGVIVGRNPKKMTRQELRDLGHEPGSALEVIRAKCLFCRDNNTVKILRCTLVRCPLWPLRLKHNPWKKKRILSAEQKKAREVRLAKGREKLAKRKSEVEKKNPTAEQKKGSA